MGQQPFLLAIGDTGLTEAWVVTPNGSAPLRGSQWIVRDSTVTTSAISTDPIVLAILVAVFSVSVAATCTT